MHYSKDLRRYPTAKIRTPPLTICRTGPDREYSVLYSHANARSKSVRDNDTNETPWGRQCLPAHSSWMRDTTRQLHPQNVNANPLGTSVSPSPFILDA